MDNSETLKGMEKRKWENLFPHFTVFTFTIYQSIFILILQSWLNGRGF